MRANFTDCAARFAANTTQGQQLREQWGWRGPVVGIDRDPFTLISRAGCINLCGAGPMYYAWTDVSSTLTTWILPIIGVLVQAPFESNAFKRTMLVIARWVGSPIASLSYVLWNIKVNAKAALMVDMAVKYDQLPKRKSDFGSIRDSMYLLVVMNQYTMNHRAASKEAEGLLRIVLFSRDLKLIDTDLTLCRMRRILAQEIREIRRHGAVPVFVSTLWFLFAFALSIQAAFGDYGENRTAHDLALGCLLAWFPILIMGSIVDRNPVAADVLRSRLNALIDHVRRALRDEHNRRAFFNSFCDQPRFTEFQAWVNGVAESSEFMDDFFLQYAGQARVRWHYGAAHPILCDIEDCYIADKGRNWLANEAEARMNLVLGPVNDDGLVWFDMREFWQVGSAIVIVGASCGGAFILSFFTPTVGLGCRSGGYTIFFCISLGLLIVEMLVWLVLSPYQIEQSQGLPGRLRRSSTYQQFDGLRHYRWAYLKRRSSDLVDSVQGALVRIIVRSVKRLPWKDRAAAASKVERYLDDLLNTSPQQKWDAIFFRLIEIVNTIWLIYIVMAQTIGSYKTCACVTSTWGGGGGYLDFGVQDTSNSPWVAYYWTAGTFVTSIAMGLAMIYITIEWCQQSFLSTENYQDAIKGLERTRKFRYWTLPLRKISRGTMWLTLKPLEKAAVFLGVLKKPPKTLFWTKNHSWDPQAENMVTRSRHGANPSIELPDHSTANVHGDMQHVPDTPAMAHSLFPPLTPDHRSLSDRDSTTNFPSSSVLPRYSQDSGTTPLIHIQRPSEVHQHRERAGSVLSDRDDRSSDEWIASPTSPPAHVQPQFAFGLSTPQPRQGYTRNNSDPAIPPMLDGLGIRTDPARQNDEHRT